MKRYLPIFAWDNGYGLHKFFSIIDEGNTKYNLYGEASIPFAVYEIGESILEKSLSGLDESRKVLFKPISKPSINDLVIEYEGRKYAIGKNAIDMGANTVEKDYKPTKFRNIKETLHLFAGIAHLLPNYDEIEIGELALGMSIEAYNTQNEKGQLFSDEIKEQYTNVVYTFKTKESNGRIREVSLKINSASCTPQGVGALYDKIFDLLPDGRIIGVNEFKDYRHQRYGLCDIGNKTNDAFICNGTKPVSGKEVYNDFGLSEAYTAVSKRLGNCPENMVEDFYLEQMQDLLPSQKKPYLYWDNNKYLPNTVLTICNESFSDLGAKIVDKLNTKWKNDIPTLQMILLCGGGAKIVEPYLKNTFNTTITVINNPQMANVKGFYKVRKMYYDLITAQENTLLGR